MSNQLSRTSLGRSGRSILPGLLDPRPGAVPERTPAGADDAVARGLAMAKVYAFASVDYPGAALSQVYDTDGTTAVGAFVVDPGLVSSPMTAFTSTGTDYAILAVPGSTSSVATGINGVGMIVGSFDDLGGVRHGFVVDGGAVSTLDFPGADESQAFGVNDAGDIVGSHVDASGDTHGFLSSGGTVTSIDFPGASFTACTGINGVGDIVGLHADATGAHGFLLRAGVFTPIDFPLADLTIAFGIDDTGEIAGLYRDVGGATHGFVFAGGAFSTVDVAGARDTQLTGITGGGLVVTGAYTDALNELHGLTGR